MPAAAPDETRKHATPGAIPGYRPGVPLDMGLRFADYRFAKQLTLINAFQLTRPENNARFYVSE